MTTASAVSKCLYRHGVPRFGWACAGLDDFDEEGSETCHYVDGVSVVYHARTPELRATGLDRCARTLRAHGYEVKEIAWFLDVKRSNGAAK